jgi:hypothetical protein
VNRIREVRTLRSSKHIRIRTAIRRSPCSNVANKGYELDHIRSFQDVSRRFLGYVLLKCYSSILQFCTKTHGMSGILTWLLPLPLSVYNHSAVSTNDRSHPDTGRQCIAIRYSTSPPECPFEWCHSKHHPECQPTSTPASQSTTSPSSVVSSCVFGCE